MLNNSMINGLRAAFMGTGTCTPEHFAKMKGILAMLKSADLVRLRDEKIRFVSTAANSLLVDRGELPASARWDWFVEVSVDGVIERHAPLRAVG